MISGVLLVAAVYAILRGKYLGTHRNGYRRLAFNETTKHFIVAALLMSAAIGVHNGF